MYFWLISHCILLPKHKLVRSSCVLALCDFLLYMCIFLSAATFPANCLSFPYFFMRASHAFLPTVFPLRHAFSLKWACAQHNVSKSTSITSLYFPPTMLIAYLRQTLASIPLNLYSMYVLHNDPNSLLDSQ